MSPARLILVTCAIVGECSLFAQGTSAARSATVPFVGCKSDGQTGPLDAPSGRDLILPITAEAARRLSYYKAQQRYGVLAPRGWYCFGTYGSGGDAIRVSPQPINASQLFSRDRKGFTGPIIALVRNYGGTSGRYSVASVIARVFPTHDAFVRQLQRGEPTMSFATGPYLGDKLTYKSKEIVEYQTPAQTEGLGTYSGLLKNDSAISGVAILVGDFPDLLLLSIRVPAELTGLTSAIISQMERDAEMPPL
jgi:hypothetical protein